MIIWDFNEDKNYIQIGKYKVLDKKDAMAAAILLGNIEAAIKKIFKKLNIFNTDEINLLLSTPFKLQEMQELRDQGNIKFEGLNKPKGVTRTRGTKIGEDGSLRAESRLIFLTLRDTNGKLKKINQLYSLIAHELSHTALNHVTWRDDNHPEKFLRMHNLLFGLFLTPRSGS